MHESSISFMAGGPAGSGVMSLGAMVGKGLQHCGMHVFQTAEYPNLIKGGHNVAYVRASHESVYSQIRTIDVLLAIDKLTAELHEQQITPGGAILYDEKIGALPQKRTDITCVAVPFQKFGRDAGSLLYANSAAIGATLALLGVPFENVQQSVRALFGKKGETVVSANIAAAKLGFDFVKEKNVAFRKKVTVQPKKKTILISGNAAACAGAIKGGVKLVAEYPMSPSSSVLHFMAAQERNFGIVVKHTEDEIAAINMLLGGAFAGVRTLTATSGGGFALMAEALGLAGISETPCVILESQRCGPSTGIPTYTEQADLRFAIHASQGEFPRVVIAPGDIEETFYHTFNACNIAEQLQVPVIVLLDKHLSESSWSVPSFDHHSLKINRGKLQSDEQMEHATAYKRYEVTKDGISPRAIPGQQNGIHVCSSYEHDETSYSCEDGQNRITQIQKRARKLEALDPHLSAPSMFGSDKADILLVAWGSTKGAVLEAMRALAKEGITTRFMHIIYAHPLNAQAVSGELKKAKTSIIFEGNSDGQMRGLIFEKTGIRIPHAHNRYDGRPFDPEEIVDAVKKVARHG